MFALAEAHVCTRMLLCPLFGALVAEDRGGESLMERLQRRLALDELGVHERHLHVSACIEPLQHVLAGSGQ